MFGSPPVTVHPEVCEVTDVHKSLLTGYIGTSCGMGLAILDRDRKHVYYNQEYLDHFGVSTEVTPIGTKFDKFLELGLAQYVTDEKLQQIQSLMQVMSARLSAGVHARTAHKITAMDGRVVKMNGIYTPDNHLVITLEDVTERERKERLLNISMESGKAGYWHFDFKSEKFTFSDSFLKRFSGEDVAKIQQSGLWAILDSADLPTIMDQWQKAIRGEGPVDFTCKAKTTHNGEIWTRSVGEVIYDNSGTRNAVIAFVRDITDEVQRRDELVAAQRSSKAKTEFLARMSHEIKTPLNAIIGLSDVLLSEELTEDMRETVEYIDESAQGLHYLLNQTLDHAKLVSEKMEPEFEEDSPRKILNSSCGFWRAQAAAKKLYLKLHIDDSIPDLMLIDRFRVQQCMNNLLSNAIKFTDEGGIHVVVKKASGKEGDRLIIGVKDSGIGMTEEQLGRIFNPFEQAENSITRKYGGTGLGMSITEQLVGIMGGKISVRSESGKGTVFAITLPINKPLYSGTAGQPPVMPANEAPVPMPKAETIRELPQPSPAEPTETIAQPNAEPARDEAIPAPNPVALEVSAAQTFIERAAPAPAPAPAPIATTVADNNTAQKPSPSITELIAKAQSVKPSVELAQPVVHAEPKATQQTVQSRANPDALLTDSFIDDFTQEVPFENLSVLCVEDNPINQKVVRKMLGNLVSQLHFAGNGKEALEALENHHVDVILMDIHMPVMDGIETTMAIRNSDETWANVVIIALTADPDYQHRRVCRNLGMDDSIVKPVRRHDILEAFGRSIDRISSDYGQTISLADSA